MRTQHPTWERLATGYDLVFEAPITFAYALGQAAHADNDPAGAQLMEILEQAEQAATRVLQREKVRIAAVARHMMPDGVHEYAPHLHVTTTSKVSAIYARQAVVEADEWYQRTISGLCGEVGLRSVAVPESAHGWQLADWLDMYQGDPTRCEMRPSLWPLELRRPWLQHLQQPA
jgi:hypothetical protein